MNPKRFERRRFLTAAVGSVLPARAQASKRPNILFLLADDLRWNALGCMGNSIVLTPAIDRLAAGGVLFENHFCATPVCGASRATLFTGQYERTHGISGPPKGLSREVFANSYPALLRKDGYRTGFIGKYGLGGGLPAGEFDYFKGFSGQGFYAQEVSGKPVHLTDLMEDQALEFLGRCSASQPFCLSVSFKAPHVQDQGKDPATRFPFAPRFGSLYADKSIPSPKTAQPRYFDALPPFVQKSEGHRRWQMEMSTPADYQASLKGYYRLIAGIDEVVRRIMEALEKADLAGNTVVLFSSDNGFFVGERELSGKFLMYEESLRTPLIIHDPRNPPQKGARRRREMTLNVDIAPTILRLAGIDLPRTMQGRELNTLLGGSVPVWRREFFASHLLDHPAIPKSEGIRTERWKYIRYIEADPLTEELYDLREDPFEETNLARAGRHEEQLNTMRGRWKAWRTALENWKPGNEWREPQA